MSGLTAWHSPLPDAKPRLELYVWSLIEDARRGRVCALMLDMWVIFWIVGARVVRVSGSGGGARNVAAAVFAPCC